MKAKLKFIIPALAAVIAIAAAVILIGFSPANKAYDLTSMMSTAQKFLSEQKFMQAIAEFEKIIELDPKNVEAYLGIAEAYEALGDTEAAVRWLEKGFIETDDGRIRAYLEILKSAAGILSDTEAAFTEARFMEAPSYWEKTVSETAVEYITVPDVIGLSAEEAAAVCDGAGLKYIMLEGESTTVQSGYVISQQIPAGTEVTESAVVTIYVSIGSSASGGTEYAVTTVSETEPPYVHQTLVTNDTSVSETVLISEEEDIPILSLAVDNSSITVEEGERVKIKVTAKGSHDVLLSYPNAKYASVEWGGTWNGDTRIIDITGKKEGTVNIKVIMSDNTYINKSVKVNVVSAGSDKAKKTDTKPKPALTVSSKNVTVYEGESFTVKVNVTGSDSVKLDNSNSASVQAEWKGSGGSRDLVITGKKEGAASVKVFISEDNSIYQTVSVTVKKAPTPEVSAGNESTENRGNKNDADTSSRFVENKPEEYVEYYYFYDDGDDYNDKQDHNDKKEDYNEKEDYNDKKDYNDKQDPYKDEYYEKP